jgi:hypothetical protein
MLRPKQNRKIDPRADWTLCKKCQSFHPQAYSHRCPVRCTFCGEERLTTRMQTVTIVSKLPWSGSSANSAQGINFMKRHFSRNVFGQSFTD